MKVELDCEDIASVLRSVKNNIGAYLAGVKAEKRVVKLPWGSPPGSYVEAILDDIAEFYDKKAT